jgi:transcriptional regulator with XRE-family HTH domain
MAARSGISAASLGRYENGITQPTVGRLEAIARAFGLGVADLFRAADTYSGTGLYLNALAASAA